MPHNRGMRFLHTADWHIGLEAAFAGSAAPRVRDARLEAARNVIQAAREHSAEFIVAAGDTFDHNAIARHVVAEVADIFGSAPCPVFVIAGNHDPLEPASVWNHPAWRTANRVKILTERNPVSVGGGTLYPCPLTRKRSEEEPSSWIPVKGDGIRIAIAHGNAGDIMAEDGGHPIPFGAAERLSLDYVALGHWHSTLEFPSGAATRMAYCGAPETASFGERDSGNVLLVDIAQHGAPPVLNRIRTGVLSFVNLEENVTVEGRLAEFVRQMAALPNPDTSLIQIRLRGLLFERDRDELGRIRSACSRCLHSRVDESGLRPAPQDAAWVRGLPPGVIAETAQRLRGLASEGGEQSAVAMQALLELYAIYSEVRA